MPFAQVGPGLRLSYSDAGEGPAVLWIHGGMGGPFSTLGTESGIAARGDNPTTRRLVAAGYRVIAYDRRSCGRSDYVTDRYYTVQDLAADARALLRALGVDHLRALIGTSMGGVVAQQFALDYPGCFSRLVLLNTSPVMMSETPWGPSLDALYQECLARGERAVFSGIAGKLRRGLEQAGPVIKSRLAAVTEDELFRLWQGEQRNAVAFLGYDYRPRLRNIRKPCLIVHGDADEVVPFAHSKMLCEGIAGAQLHAVPGGQHGIWAHPACTAALLEWLQSGAESPQAKL